jgi:hypothetical protein
MKEQRLFFTPVSLLAQAGSHRPFSQHGAWVVAVGIAVAKAAEVT